MFDYFWAVCIVKR